MALIQYVLSTLPIHLWNYKLTQQYVMKLSFHNDCMSTSTTTLFPMIKLWNGIKLTGKYVNKYSRHMTSQFLSHYSLLKEKHTDTSLSPEHLQYTLIIDLVYKMLLQSSSQQFE